MASAHYERGTILYNQKNYKLAIKEYREALQAEPNHLQALRMLAMSLSLDKQHKDAERTVKDLLARSPDDADFQYIAGLVYFNKGTYKDAEKYLKTSLAKETNQPHIFYVLSKIEGTRAAWKKMRDYAKQGLSLDPNDVKCLLGAATAESKLGNWREAQSLLLRALEVSPNDAKAHAELGHVLLKNGNPDQAREHLREALRLDPNCSEALDGFIESLRAKNKIYYSMIQVVWFFFRGQTSFAATLNILALGFVPLRALIFLVLFSVWTAKELATLAIRFDKEVRHYLPPEIKKRNTRNLICIFGIFALVGTAATMGYVDAKNYKLNKVKELKELHKDSEAQKIEKEMLNEFLTNYRSGHMHESIYQLEELKEYLSQKENYEPRKLAWANIWLASKQKEANKQKDQLNSLDQALVEALKAKDKELVHYINNLKKNL